VLGISVRVLQYFPNDDERLEDLTEIHKAATAAVALLNSHRGPNRERA
jgi:hypothetical protein